METQSAVYYEPEFLASLIKKALQKITEVHEEDYGFAIDDQNIHDLSSLTEVLFKGFLSGRLPIYEVPSLGYGTRENPLVSLWMESEYEHFQGQKELKKEAKTFELESYMKPC